MRTYKVGVAGLGFIGAAHIDAIRRVENAELVALADVVDVEAKAARLNVPQAYRDYRDMIDRAGLDAVHICTPNDTHFEIAMHAMEKGLAVLCEKPFMRTVEQARAALAKAKETGVRHAVNHHNRFYPAPNGIRHLVGDGALGDVVTVHGGYVQDWLVKQTDFNWRLLQKNTGKTMVTADIGSHWMDLAEFLTGLRIVQVFAEFGRGWPVRLRTLPDGSTEPVEIDTEDTAYLLLRFDNGAIGSAAISAMTPGEKNHITVVVSGRKQSATWDTDAIGDLVLGRRGEGNVVVTKAHDLSHPATVPLIAYPGGHVEGFPDAFRQHFRQFYQSLADPSMKTEYATFEDGLRNMVLCEAAYESARTGRWVDVRV